MVGLLILDQHVLDNCDVKNLSFRHINMVQNKINEMLVTFAWVLIILNVVVEIVDIRCSTCGYNVPGTYKESETVTKRAVTQRAPFVSY